VNGRGTTRRLRIGELRFALWTAADADDRSPLLVVHDGPEYVRKARLLSALRRLPPVRAALLESPDRDEEYAASPEYARLLMSVLAELAPPRRRVGVGCSLGALALLHLHWTEPGALAGLFLQSGSFFRRRDRHEAGFPRYSRISRFVERVHREGGARRVPVTITCGREQNLRANRALFESLADRDWDVRLIESPGGHDWSTWRLTLDPHLGDLLRRALR
jgi:enterochelin esterase-like enzyme